MELISISLLSLLLLVSTTFGNRYIGSDEWRKTLEATLMIKDVRVAPFIFSLLLMIAISVLVGKSDFIAFAGLVSLVGFWALGRLRSPRGGNFIYTGGRNGGPNGVRYDGKHNTVSQWLATKSCGVRFDEEIQLMPVPTRSKRLVTYGLWYEFWHHLWIYLAFLPLITLLVFKYAFVLAPLTMLGGLINYHCGILGWRKNEVMSRPLAERYQGVIVYGLTILLNILGGAYLAPGLISQFIN